MTAFWIILGIFVAMITFWWLPAMIYIFYEMLVGWDKERERRRHDVLDKNSNGID